MKMKTNLITLYLISINLCLYSFAWRQQQQQQKGEEKDLYKLLEITKRATKEEIKKQYRKLTRKYHPDRNPDTKDLFTDITEAYEILSDPKIRRVYDTKGYQAAKSATHSQNEGGDDMDILSRFFGGQVKRENKMDDMRVKVRVSLDDLYNGKELDFKYTRNIICPHCRGTGADSEHDVKVCNKCNGNGVILETKQLAPGYIQQFQRHCDKCGGKGKIISKQCHICHGNKIVPGLETLSVYIEKGMKHGQEIVFDDAADESADKNPGNIVFVINEGKHKTFMRDGNNLHTDLEISLKDALIGFTKTITHLDKRKLSVSLSEPVQPDFVIKMKNEGMPIHERSEEFGDLFIKIKVKFPESLTEEQKLIAEKLFSRRSNW